MVQPHPPPQPTTTEKPTVLSRAEQIAERARREVQAQGGVPKLMKPPKPHTPYHHQALTLTLYRRIEGDFPQKGVTERRIEMPDGSGYILLEGKNVNVEDCDFVLTNPEENWNIRMRGQNNQRQVPPEPQDSGGSPIKKPKN